MERITITGSQRVHYEQTVLLSAAEYARLQQLAEASDHVGMDDFLSEKIDQGLVVRADQMEDLDWSLDKASQAPTS